MMRWQRSGVLLLCSAFVPLLHFLYRTTTSNSKLMVVLVVCFFHITPAVQNLVPW